ncbi:MAG: DUF3108 domain-containing protein [Bacteroidales bacterium]|jgi:hypothetical protein|nr:DUF3108 domain-containing protein [Bacteroidales bacterium]
MMKKLLLISVFLFLVISRGTGQISSYQPGEKINYTVHYGLITGGTGTLELKTDTINGKEVWHSYLLAKTTGMADAIFKVRDIYESYMNPETELPVKSIRNISEGRYRKYNEVMFDHVSRNDSAILTSDLTGVHITTRGIHDILSCFYWFRNHILPDIENIKKGETITIITWFTDEFYPIRMKYIGPEEIKTRAGKIKCHKFNPVTETGRLFKTEEDVSFWFSADKNYLPVKVRFDIFVGAFTVEIVNYEGLVYPLDIKKK